MYIIHEENKRQAPMRGLYEIKRIFELFVWPVDIHGNQQLFHISMTVTDGTAPKNTNELKSAVSP